MGLSNIKEKVLKKIKPYKKEDEEIRLLTHKVLDILQDLGHEAVLVGSIGKHTWLKGDHDIDIFIFFPKDVAREDLEKKGLEIGQEVCKKIKAKPVLKYAEHPYTQTQYKGFDIDIVPCCNIDKGEKIISAVDRSPLHLKYILETLKPEQRDEVRLLKQFMKGAGVYGSDVKHLGFSGYVCELLVIKYGSFENALKEIEKWKIPQILDMDQNVVKKLQGSLFVSDPVDPERNASAAVSSESLVRLISASKYFLSKPNKEMFFPKLIALSKPEIKKIKSRDTCFLALQSKRPDIVNDTLFPQLRKAADRLEAMLNHEDFHVLKTVEYADNKNMFILFEFASACLSNIKQMFGPPIYSRFHSSEFIEKYKNCDFGPFAENNRWVVEIKRKHRIPESLIKEFLKQPENVLVEKGIPKHVVKPIKFSRFVKEKTLWNIMSKNKKLSDFVRRKYYDSLRI